MYGINYQLIVYRLVVLIWVAILLNQMQAVSKTIRACTVYPLG